MYKKHQFCQNISNPSICLDLSFTPPLKAWIQETQEVSAVLYIAIIIPRGDNKLVNDEKNIQKHTHKKTSILSKHLKSFILSRFVIHTSIKSLDSGNYTGSICCVVHCYIIPRGDNKLVNDDGRHSLSKLCWQIRSKLILLL